MIPLLKACLHSESAALVPSLWDTCKAKCLFCHRGEASPYKLGGVSRHLLAERDCSGALPTPALPRVRAGLRWRGVLWARVRAESPPPLLLGWLRQGRLRWSARCLSLLCPSSLPTQRPRCPHKSAPTGFSQNWYQQGLESLLRGKGLKGAAKEVPLPVLGWLCHNMQHDDTSHRVQELRDGGYVVWWNWCCLIRHRTLQTRYKQ